MDPRVILTRGVSTGLRFGRGTADRVVTIAGPPLGRLTDKLVSRVRRPEHRGPTTFTPSKRNDVPEPAAPSRTPSPSVVARNIGPKRPTAKPARPARPKSVPGAKLPPPRASTL
ncbi:MAG: hypothetical protein QOD98_583 [Nocardioidaceae bacterium]|jgi:hypothetical protein|nr:hypothetical protein [Nocardioidaceae bacterium]